MENGLFSNLQMELSKLPKLTCLQPGPVDGVHGGERSSEGVADDGPGGWKSMGNLREIYGKSM